MDNNIKNLVAIIVVAIILTGGLLWVKDSITGNNNAPDIVIRYLSASTIIEPYEFAKELG